MKIKRLLLFTGLVAILLAGLGWATTAAGKGARRECAFEHRIRRDDTLSRIAAYYGVGIDRIARANNISNHNLIITGRILCIPSRLPPSPAHLDLVATYHFSHTEDVGALWVGEDDPLRWTLGRGGVGGVRSRYPLLSGERIHTFGNPVEVEEASRQARQLPVFWLVRNNAIEENPSQPFSYTLVVFGSAAPLAELQLGFDKPLAEMLDDSRLPETEATVNNCTRRAALPVSALADPNKVMDLQLHAELYGSDGVFIPITISAVDYAETRAEAEEWFDCVGFAIHANRNPDRNGYQVYMVLNEDGAGPPGPQWGIRCARWSGNNWWSRWLRRWYRC